MVKLKTISMMVLYYAYNSLTLVQNIGLILEILDPQYTFYTELLITLLFLILLQVKHCAYITKKTFCHASFCQCVKLVTVLNEKKKL